MMTGSHSDVSSCHATFQHVVL